MVLEDPCFMFLPNGEASVTDRLSVSPTKRLGVWGGEAYFCSGTL